MRTPLSYACESGNLDLVKLLLDHQADVNEQDLVTMHNIDVCMCTHQVFILKDVHISFTCSDFRPWCL